MRPTPEEMGRQLEREDLRKGGPKGRLILWWNCAGGVASKLNFIKNLIYKQAPALLFVSESNTKSGQINSHFNIGGYEFVTTESEFSRTACYLKMGSGFKVVSRGAGLEVITVEDETTRIMGIYRPFKVTGESTLTTQFDSLLEFIHVMSQTGKKLIVAGDFNIDYAKKGDRSYRNSKMLEKLEVWAATFGLSQKIDKITRRRVAQTNEGVRVEESILDHLYLMDEEIPILIDGETSDHLIIGTHLIGEKVPIFASKKIIRRDWREYTQDRAITLINNMCLDTIEEINDGDHLHNRVKAIHTEILNTLAPLRTFRVRDDLQLVNSSIEALKKKRNRKFIMYKKTNNPAYLEQAQALSKKLKKDINKMEREIIQKKAESPDPRHFWNTISELRNGKRNKDNISIRSDSAIIVDPHTIANMFGEFFTTKIEKLGEQTYPEQALGPITLSSGPINISAFEVAMATRGLKSKKSSGIDNIPLCIVKDTEPVLRRVYMRLFSLATLKIPEEWKMAKVIPLLKKGDKELMSNYRPISNLCSISKLFEKIILNRINEYGMLDGEHQHGFRPKHGTATAILNLQRIVAGKLDENKDCIVYSVDLSAAFDMLRRNTFIESVKGAIGDEIVPILSDFLSDRKCVIDIDGTLSDPIQVKMGCVQGSVLGPKLFNLYTRNIINHITEGNEIVTYADDSYVVVSAEEGQTDLLCEKTVQCLIQHCEYLRHLGMVVNQAKTEAMYICRKGPRKLTLKIDSDTIKTQDKMQVLGIQFDSGLTWSQHISTTINKMNRLTGALKFLRRRLTEKQFLTVMTSQYYGMCYYGCQAWLGRHTRYMDLRKLNGMHYRLLRIVKMDWKQKIKRHVLDEIGRARPTTWAKYATSSTVIKSLRDGIPKRLSEHLRRTLYHERRKENIPKFYSKAKNKYGSQAIGNRLCHLFNEIKAPIYFTETDDQLRIKLKESFNLLSSPGQPTSK